MKPIYDPIQVRRYVISGILIVATFFLTIAALLKESDAAYHSAILIDFYPVERNNSGEYRFTQPRSHIFIPPFVSDAVALSFRTYSPGPLPERTLTLRLDERTFVSLASGHSVRRLLLVLSPAGVGAGQLLTLETAPAEAPGDLRRLGVFTANIELQPLNPHIYQRFALVVLAPVTASLLLLVMRCGVLASACSAALVAGMVLWGWTIAWGATFGLGVILVFDRMLNCGRGMFWLRQSIDQLLSCLSLPDMVISTLILIWISTVGWSSLAIHERYATGAYDLGLFDQWLWLISRGLTPYSTGIGVHLLGDHAAVLLYPLATLYLFVPDVRALLLVQVLAVGMGGLALYRIGSTRGSSWMGALVAGAYLLHPSTHNMALFHFHPDALAAAALLIVLLGIERRNATMMAVAVVVCAAKENFALTTALLGAWLVIRGERRLGSALFFGSLAWFSIATFLI